MTHLTELYKHRDYRDLLAACVENPLDDCARWVLSDWLEEHGDLDQATFIRIQIERARLHEADPRSMLLSFDENALVNRNRRSWLHQIPDWLQPYIHFERGLPGKARLPASLLLEHVGDDWTYIPLHDVSIQDVGNLFSTLFHCKWLTRLTSLGLSDARMPAGGMVDLLKSRHLGRIQSLDLANIALWPSHVQRLAEADNMPHLARLGLRFNPVGAEEIEALTTGAFLARITHLDLSHCYGLGPDEVQRLLDARIDNLVTLDLAGSTPFTREAVRAIATCPRLAKLESLNLSERLTSEDDIMILADSPHLTNLRDFDFFFGDRGRENTGIEGLRAMGRSPVMGNVLSFRPWVWHFGDEGLRIVAESPSFANVRDLALGVCDITPVGIEALVNSPYLRRVARLDLEMNENLTDDGVRRLAESTFVRNLLILNIGITGLTVQGATHLASPAFQQLRRLEIGCNRIGDSGIQAITAALGELRVLWANVCRIGPDGARAIANATFTAHLQQLHLAGNELGDAGAAALAQAFMPNLVALFLSDCRIGSAGAQALATTEWGDLQTLNLHGNSISDDGARALINSPNLSELTSVSLAANPEITIELPQPFTR